MDEMPLFPSATGDEISKQQSVHTIFRLAELVGEAVLDGSGSYRFGGHSLRTGGAHLLASRGLTSFRSKPSVGGGFRSSSTMPAQRWRRA